MNILTEEQKTAIVYVGSWTGNTAEETMKLCGPDQYQQLVNAELVKNDEGSFEKIVLTETGRIWYTYLLERGYLCGTGKIGTC